ncbi:MAG: S8 family serine peptidase [Chloroflexota bacterium]
MHRRLLAALATSAVLVLAIVPATVTGAAPNRQFTRLDVSKLDKTLTPAIVANRTVTVMVQLKGDAASARHGLSKNQRAAAAKQLKAAQDTLKPGIAKAGGTVVGTYQYAYNGVKVRIAGRGVAALLALPNVAAVRAVKTYTADNVHSVPFIGAPGAWEDLGKTGAGETIAVIDTGTDYLHANFGGPGTKAAFDANNPAVIEPGSFPTAKVIGGYDFAGNDYDAEGKLGSATPTPDPDPLDCNGHGSHTSGTAAGEGVLANGSTYTGPYNNATYANDFAVGPGVAPQANIVAIKIFGCEGSTDLVVDALEWVAAYNANPANTNSIDVVNMSLGAPFGRADSPDSVATDVLVQSGVVVATSAGNSGQNAYITGSPGTADRAISTAAEDTLATFPGAVIDLANSPDITNASNQNAYPHLPVSGTLRVIRDGAGAISLGCTAADYGTLPANSVVAIQRGVCPFVDKGAAAQQAGAIGIIDINRDDIVDPAELPTFIGYEPEIFDIPMIGVGNGSKATIVANDGTPVSLNPGGTISNPTYKKITSFSSGGPRNGDSAAKPDITGPGASIVSTLVGSGNKGTTLSGTSMASPHTAGVAALVHQANPTWTPAQVKAAIMNTASADASLLAASSVRVAGAGVLQPRRAVDTVALATTGDGTSSLSFGYDQAASGGYSESKPITFWNTSGSAISYNLAGASIVSVPSSITVPAHSSVTIDATASLTAAQLAAAPPTSVLLGGQPWGGVQSRSGAIVATPTTTGPGVYSLRIPFVAVPRAESRLAAGARSAYRTSGGIARATVPLTNTGVHSGIADVYAWGLSDPQDLPSAPISTDDIRAAGVQVVPAEVLTGVADPNDRAVMFAINTYGKWSTAVSNEFDIAIYGANKHKPDFIVVGVDFGFVTAGAFDGRVAAFTIDSANNVVDGWVADGPANGSTIILPTLASEIGQASDNARFTYSVTGFSVEDGSLVDAVAGQASFSAKKPPVSTGDFIQVNPGASATLNVAVDKGKFAVGPVKGWMVVTLDDPNGAAQADLIPVGTP